MEPCIGSTVPIGDEDARHAMPCHIIVISFIRIITLSPINAGGRGVEVVVVIMMMRARPCQAPCETEWSICTEQMHNALQERERERERER